VQQVCRGWSRLATIGTVHGRRTPEGLGKKLEPELFQKDAIYRSFDPDRVESSRDDLGDGPDFHNLVSGIERLGHYGERRPHPSRPDGV